jgi:hypothetical protein
VGRAQLVLEVGEWPIEVCGGQVERTGINAHQASHQSLEGIWQHGSSLREALEPSSSNGADQGYVDPEDIVALYIDGPDVNDGSDPACLKLLMTGVALQHVRIVRRCFGRVENPHDGVANGFYFAAGTVVTPVSGKQLGAAREMRSTHLSHTLVA